jgi:hypothetical protein
MSKEHDFGNYDIELEITESDRSDKLNGLYESAGLTQVEFGKIRMFGEDHTPFVFTPEGWRELAVKITEGDDKEEEDGDEKPWLAKLKAIKGMPFKKKAE